MPSPNVHGSFSAILLSCCLETTTESWQQTSAVLRWVSTVGPRPRKKTAETLQTDPRPNSTSARACYDASDRMRTPAVWPDASALQTSASALQHALAAGDKEKVQNTSATLLRCLAETYSVAVPDVEVLGARPLETVGHDHQFRAVRGLHLRNLPNPRLDAHRRACTRHQLPRATQHPYPRILSPLGRQRSWVSRHASHPRIFSPNRWAVPFGTRYPNLRPRAFVLDSQRTCVPN